MFSLSIFLCHTALAGEFSFVVVGDTQTDGGHSSINWDVLPPLIDDMNTHSPVLGLFVGDLVGGEYSVEGTVDQWQDFITATDAFSGDVLPILGNHDVYGGEGSFAAFADTFDWLPQDDSPTGEEGVSYYIDYDNTRFIAITSDQEVGTSMQISSEGLVWLENVLQASSSFEHIFVYTHHPVTFSDENNHGGTAGDFWKLLVAHDVTGVFSGHWHRYQPSQPGAGGDTWETIIGTGGGYIGFDPIRTYQQMHGFLVVHISDEEATAQFYADADGDGFYDDLMDEYTMASSTPLATGLIARYRFDEGVVADSAPGPLGRGIGGSLEGGATLGAGGVQGDALWLGGTDDYAVAGAIDDYVLSLNNDLTISLWANFDEFGTGDWANTLLNYGTADYYTEDEETNYSYWLNVEADKTLRAFWEYESGYNTSVFSTEAADLTTDSWHHIAFTRDATSMEVSFYIDGQALGEPVAFERLPTSGGRGMLYLGSDNESYQGSGYEINGKLDEICIYNQVLDASQVAELSLLSDCEEVTLEETTETETETATETETETETDTQTAEPSAEEPSDESEPATENTDTTTDQGTSSDDGVTENAADDDKIGAAGTSCSTAPGIDLSLVVWFLGLLLFGGRQTSRLSQ